MSPVRVLDYCPRNLETKREKASGKIIDNDFQICYFLRMMRYPEEMSGRE